MLLVVTGCTSSPEREGDQSASASPTASSPPAEPSPPATSSLGEPSPTEPTPTEPSESSRPPETADARVSRIPDQQWREIVATGTWRPGCPVGRRGLRRVEVNHHTFDGDVARGTLVVNRDVARSLSRIFTRLYDAGFPIRRMRPVETFDGDSNASLRADNTAAFNCRRPDQINAPTKLSPHANGRAIDINPRENPWQDLRCRCWSPGPRHHARTPGKGKILRGGLVWRLFRGEGWIWQNISVPDYMHFDTGYPSGPFDGKR
jgi:hypothetical protein